MLRASQYGQQSEPREKCETTSLPFNFVRIAALMQAVRHGLIKEDAD